MVFSDRRTPGDSSKSTEVRRLPRARRPCAARLTPCHRTQGQFQGAVKGASFDADVLDLALNDASEEDCRYEVRGVCFSTRDQGVPVDRRRRYSMCTRIIHINIKKYKLSYFSLVTFRRLEINGSIFSKLRKAG